jgi:membrane-bound metal-dependent hydrolase YbcI (DUF457 family)
MMGRSHATIGALCGLGLGVAGFGAQRPELVVVSTLVGAGAGLLPDLDEENSTVARAGGLATKAVSHVTRRVAGGHRRATHSFLGIGVMVGALAIGAAFSPNVVPIVGGLLAALAVRITASVLHVGHFRRWLAEIAVGAAVGWVLIGTAGGPILGLVAVGMVSHSLADDLTDSGTPLFWPWKWRLALHLFHTGSKTETAVRWCLYAALVGLAYVAIAPHAAALGHQVHHSVAALVTAVRPRLAGMVRRP